VRAGSVLDFGAVAPLPPYLAVVAASTCAGDGHRSTYETAHSAHARAALRKDDRLASANQPEHLPLTRRRTPAFQARMRFRNGR